MNSSPDTPNLNILYMYTNCDCLTQAKLSKLYCYIESYSPDIIALNEVLPKRPAFETSTELYKLEGYTMFSSDLNHGTEILVYVKESLGATDCQLVDPQQDMFGISYLW